MEKIKNIAIGIVGIGIFIIFYYILYRIFGKDLVDGILFVLTKISPIAGVINIIIFAISVIAFPIAFLKRFRSFFANFYQVAAYMFIITVIIRCFNYSYINYGFVSFIGAIGYGIGFIPIALVTYIIHGMWINALEVSALVAVVFLFRYFSSFLKRKNDILYISLQDDLIEKSEKFKNDYKELKRFLEIAQKNINSETARNELLISDLSARRKLKEELKRIERSKPVINEDITDWLEHKDIETIFTAFHLTVLNTLFYDLKQSYDEYKSEYALFIKDNLSKFSAKKQSEIKLNHQLYNAMYKSGMVTIVEIANKLKIDISLYKVYTCKFAFEDLIAKERLEKPDSYSIEEIEEDKIIHDVFQKYQNHTSLFEEELEKINQLIANDPDISHICNEFSSFKEFLKDIDEK